MLKDKIVLITGASGGIGAAIAKDCAAQGAQVWRAYHSHKPADTIAGETLELDLADPASIKAAVEQVAKVAGRIDGLVNCGGIHVEGPLVSLSTDDITRQLAVNLTGSILMTQAVAPHMMRARAGSIVMIGSVSAHRMARGHAVYSATKAGLEGFSAAMAAELAKRQVRVNTVVPGPVLTAMLKKTIDQTGDDPAARVPLGRLIEADEVAKAVTFLLSDQASAITGTTLPVDGGYLLW